MENGGEETGVRLAEFDIDDPKVALAACEAARDLSARRLVSGLVLCGLWGMMLGAYASALASGLSANALTWICAACVAAFCVLAVARLARRIDNFRLSCGMLRFVAREISGRGGRSE